MKLRIVIIGLVLLIGACKNAGKNKAETPAAKEDQIVESEWVDLMDPSDWRGYNQDSLPSNWSIKDNVIECFGEAGDVGGDIISTETYDNFEFAFEWKITKGGNSGAFYHVVEDTIYHSPYETGPEYQLLDDVGFDEPLEDWQKTGANYAMHVANENKILKPVGEWNTSKIVFNRGKAEHWLNGKKIVEFDKNSQDWLDKRNSGKWNDYPDYGKSNDGYLALQDHGAGVWFRNVKVRRL
ncbi:MAG: DUF1080 domain-containing protein [Flavobacteriaceae bacterium]|nr:MAG: DUF1080 domain-containing protein [Flavobacteriaceae bacterium]